MNVQADLNLCWVQMFEGTFSDVAAHIKIYLLYIVLETLGPFLFISEHIQMNNEGDKNKCKCQPSKHTWKKR